MKDLQIKIDQVFKEHFGITTFKERINDIQNEFFELMRWKDVNDIKNESGDLLCSLIELATESGWNAEEMILNTLNKIEKRKLQYKSLGRKYKIAIYGGSFNPICKHHIDVAKFILNTSGEFDEVWLLPSYSSIQNKELESPEHRLKMCQLACEVDRRIKVFDYEIRNQLSGETYNFFKRLLADEELTEIYNFSMVIGLDNANAFDKWVNYENLERLVRFVVIPRKGVEPDPKVNWYLKPPHIYLNNENHISEMSSSYIRKLLGEYRKKPDVEVEFFIQQHLNKNVFQYIIDNKLYI